MAHIPYVYRLTDKVTGKRYIGSRYAKVCDPSDLGVTYFTSRPEVKTMFKFDPDRFKKQIMVTGTKEYVIEVEKTLIDLYDAVKSDDFYNRTNNKAIHVDDAARGRVKTHSEKDGSGKSLHAVKIGRGNVESGWAYKLGQLGKASGRLPLMAKEAGKKGGKIGGKIASKRLNGILYKCGCCDLTTTIGPLASHQKASNHFGKSVI